MMLCGFLWSQKISVFCFSLYSPLVILPEGREVGNFIYFFVAGSGGATISWICPVVLCPYSPPTLALQAHLSTPPPADLFSGSRSKWAMCLICCFSRWLCVFTGVCVCVCAHIVHFSWSFKVPSLALKKHIHPHRHTHILVAPYGL